MTLGSIVMASGEVELWNRVNGTIVKNEKQKITLAEKILFQSMF